MKCTPLARDFFRYFPSTSATVLNILLILLLWNILNGDDIWPVFRSHFDISVPCSKRERQSTFFRTIGKMWMWVWTCFSPKRPAMQCFIQLPSRSGYGNPSFASIRESSWTTRNCALWSLHQPAFCFVLAHCNEFVEPVLPIPETTVDAGNWEKKLRQNLRFRTARIRDSKPNSSLGHLMMQPAPRVSLSN